MRNKAIVGAIFLLLLIGGYLLVQILPNGGSDGGTSQSAVTLSLLAIGGIILMLAALAAVSILLSFLDLADKTQALALPEGSIRAVIALSLVVLFSIMSIFHFESISSAGRIRSIEHLTAGDKETFSRNIPESQLLGSIMTKKEFPEEYTIYFEEYFGESADDFAKQLLILIGTLMASVTSFYFGAKTVTAAVAAATQASETAKLPLAVRAVDPKVTVVAGDPKDVPLAISGDNLNEVKEVKLVLGNKQIVATDVVFNASVVKCTVHLDAESTKEWM